MGAHYWFTTLLVSVLFLVYVFVLYPAAVIVAARLFGREPVRTSITPTVTVLLAVRDGAQWIRRKLESIEGLDYPSDLIEVIVVSDGSMDDTAQIVDSWPASNVTLAETPRQGKWAAINRGLELAGGDVIFFTDVRQALDPRCLRAMTSRLGDQRVGAVSGELVIRSSGKKEIDSVGIYWTYEKLIRKSQSQLGSATGATGAVYIMRRELTRPLPPYCIDDDVYLPIQSILQGKRVVFEEGALAYDDPTSLSQEFRRKVRTLAGVYQILGFLPRLWLPGNGIWFHFWSHKMARLITPFALLAVAISCAALLPSRLAVAGLALQALCYGLALADPLIGEGRAVKRISSTCRAFATLQLAAAMAISIAFRPASSFWMDRRVDAAGISPSR
jgi:cellulose synthase/poly-beta-1,6-N-acetylglucosamine synthase-like glycosyltransferase